MCLFCLCFADVLYLTTLSIKYVYKTLRYVIDPQWARGVWMAYMISYRLVAIPTGFSLVSNFISIVIALERCVCVTWPLKSARVLNTKLLLAVILVVSLLFLTGMQFASFKFDVACALLKGRENLPPLILVVPSSLYHHHQVLLDVLDTVIFSSLVPTLSLLVIVVATIITAVKLRQAGIWRQHASGAGQGGTGATGSGTAIINRKEAALTRMLVAISCVYIACVSPRVLRALCRFLVPGFRAWGSLCNLMIATEALVNVTVALNSSLNFFLFFSLGSRYRATLRRLLTPRCALRNSATTSGSVAVVCGVSGSSAKSLTFLSKVHSSAE